MIGIVMAASAGRRGPRRLDRSGRACRVVGAGIVALFAGAIADVVEGSGQELSMPRCSAPRC